jgi:hypothetical protein
MKLAKVRRAPAAIVLCVIGTIALGGCALGRPSAAPTPTVSAHVSPSISTSKPPSPSPTPTPTPATDHRIGDAVVVHDPGSGSLTVQATGPKASRDKLGSYGYPPQNGHYLVFTVTVTNDTSGQVKVGPLDFSVAVDDAKHVTVQDGNSKYSGAGPQLDQTFLSPGETRHAQVTFDVSGTHGRLTYAPNGDTVCAWNF